MSPFQEEMSKLKTVYRRFLLSPVARSIDPRNLYDYLQGKQILDHEEVRLIQNEPTLPLRQYCLFLKLLPTKGAKAKEIIRDALAYCGYKEASIEWSNHVLDVPQDGYIVPTRQNLVYNERCNAHPQALFTGPPPPSAPPPPGWILPPPETTWGMQEISYRMRPTSVPGPRQPPLYPLPPPPRPPTPPSRPSPPPPLQPCPRPATPPFGESLSYVEWSSFELSAVEEPVAVHRTVTASSAPPPLPSSSISSGYQSAGILTPNTFLDSTRGPFDDRGPLRKSEVEEESIKMSDAQLGQELGRGSFADVYEGQYCNKKVAVKKFRDYDEFSLQMFIEEVKIMKELDHRNVVKYVGYVHSVDKKQLWLVTEFVPGGSLQRFCNTTRGKPMERSLPLRDKLKIAIDCWRGLEYIHGKSLCHKDISPGNILVSSDLVQVKISDFGLSEFKDLVMTVATDVSGTPMYFPPEFATEGGVIRHPVKSDIYSMGATLCELFSEQWFWNMNGQRLNQFQVMFKLAEQRRLWTQDGTAKDPDCWAKIPETVRPMLKDAITPDHKSRKSAHELCLAGQGILKQLP